METEEIKKIASATGKVRGQVFITDIEYVKNIFGEEGVIMLKNKIKEWGGLFDYDSIKLMGWYPAGFRVLSVLAAKEIFNWSDEDIFKIGNTAPKHSFIVKLLMKYFFTISKVFREGSKYWKKHYTIGELGCLYFNEKKKEGALYLKDFNLHPVLCIYYKGYFLRMAQYTLGSKTASIEEVKCSFNGDEYHEYLIKW
jgi:hypothetical protein